MSTKHETNTSSKPDFNPSGDPVIGEMKGAADKLMAYIITHVPEGRRRSLALTNLEQGMMWAVKAKAYPGE